MTKRQALGLTQILLAVAYLIALAPQARSAGEPTAAYSAPLREPLEKQLYWGDLHLHTRYSMDAYIRGTRNLGPTEAYQFAMGETVDDDNGVPARLRRPLDFLAVTDHSENMGLYVKIADGAPGVAGTELDRRWSDVLGLVQKLGLRDAFKTSMQQHGPMPYLPAAMQQQIWSEVTQLADQYNQPGQFTTLIGYEWTSMISGDNLHRVVLYRDGAALASQRLPTNAQQDPDPETLWSDLARYESIGGQALAIAHNGNLSNGRMFSPQRVNGEPLDADYARARARWEPVYEATQVKGDGESHPALSPTDEFSGFENWDVTNVAETSPKQPWMLRYEYARSALAEGLRHEQALGHNPFKFGMVGSSDIHTGLATTAEDNFFGKFPDSGPSPDRFAPAEGSNRDRNRELGAAGLAAVWAPENSREAVFDAIRRREVYATTGSRIRLRLFAGWDFVQSDIHRADYVRHGYRTGVPMGSDLPPRGAAKAPTFLVHAARDPDSAFLDRIQIIKGWIDEGGASQERIYQVALSGGREPGGGGKAEPVGSTVDIDRASYLNSIGAPELATWWRDPDFDSTVPAFYYARVLEIPTPRWTTYDAALFNSDLPRDVAATVQDRAYSSPVWYRPGKSSR